MIYYGAEYCVYSTVDRFSESGFSNDLKSFDNICVLWINKLTCVLFLLIQTWKPATQSHTFFTRKQEIINNVVLL